MSHQRGAAFQPFPSRQFVVTFRHDTQSRDVRVISPERGCVVKAFQSVLFSSSFFFPFGKIDGGRVTRRFLRVSRRIKLGSRVHIPFVVASLPSPLVGILLDVVYIYYI